MQNRSHRDTHAYEMNDKKQIKMVYRIQSGTASPCPEHIFSRLQIFRALFSWGVSKVIWAGLVQFLTWHKWLNCLVSSNRPEKSLLTQ